MKVLFLTSEFEPLAKTGGLADISYSLPKAIIKENVEINVAIPFYKIIKEKSIACKQIMTDFYIFFGQNYYSANIYKTVIDNIPVYLIENDFFFNRNGLYMENGLDYEDNALRFAFFCMQALQFFKHIHYKIDIVHANDWQTAPGIIYTKTILKDENYFRDIKTLFTIHNISYQGIFPKSVLYDIGLNDSFFHIDSLEYWGNINLMKGAIIYSDAINTVSKTYAEEIKTPQFGCGLEGVIKANEHKLSGILNGIDVEKWNPETDIFLVSNYSVKNLENKIPNKIFLQKEYGLEVDKDIPLIGMISRIVEQKGFSIILPILELFLKENNVQMIFLGIGDSGYIKVLKDIENKFPKKMVLIEAMDERLAHLIEGGADIYLMPSRFEPCGLNQMYSLVYGTIPVVNKTGGLADTIIDYSEENLKNGLANGFCLPDYSPQGLMYALKKAIDIFKDKTKWRKLMENAMNCDFSWTNSAKKYIELYQQCLQKST